ncbi:MAG: hypothetical protein CVU39_14410 [Chloroflexi bacterium HGW-Chloroflexi-10]|nr:MAG: hypothetical protein CVU39_14410 [Chloroflexi bacterium HGW-Chloroflexi-10]
MKKHMNESFGLLMVILLVCLVACQRNTVVVEGDTLSKDITADVAAVTDIQVLPEDSQWPKELPAELPVLDAPIETVMAAGTLVRIFYVGVSEETFLDYLGRLKAAGCELQAVVYNSNPTSDENAKKRAQRGEYDAIYTSLDDLDLRLEVSWDGGEGRVTYDIDGLNTETAAAIDAPDWPANWADLVPQPQGCTLIRPSIMEAGDERLMVLCAHAEILDEERLVNYREYIQVLLDLGYQMQSSPEDVSLTTRVTLVKNTVTVDLDPEAGGSLMINAQK